MKPRRKLNVVNALILLPVLAVGLFVPCRLFTDWVSRFCAVGTILWLAQSMVWPFIFVQGSAANEYVEKH